MKLKIALFSMIVALLPAVGVSQISLAQVDISSEVCSTSPRPAICDDINAVDGTESTNPLYGPDGVLTSAVNILSILAGVAAVIMLILGGIKMALGQGDPGKISGARNQIIYALVGIAVAVVAQGVVRLVLNNI